MTDTLESLLKNQKDIQLEINNLKENLIIMENKKKINNKKIFDTCQHKWIKDNSFLGPYEKPDLICNICGSIDYRW